MAIGNGVVIRFLADTGSAVRNIGKLEKATGRSMSRMGKARAVWSKAAPALAGVAAAAGAAFAVLGTEGVKAAIDQEKANRRLAQSLRNLGLEEHTDGVLASVDAMQRLYGVSEDELLPGFGRLIAVTKDITDANTLLQTALDLSAAKGIPMSRAVDIVAKAATGAYGPLRRIAPELAGIAVEGAPAEKVLKALNKQIDGSAAANADTMAGTLDRIAIGLSEVQEAFGEGFTDGLAGPDADKAIENLKDLETNSRLAGEGIAWASQQTLDWLANLVLVGQNIGPIWDNWINELSGGVTNVRDWMGNIPLPGGNPLALTDEEAAAQRRAQEAQARRNQLQIYQNQLPDPEPVPNPYEQYRPMRVRPRYDDATGRGDGRAAQKGARTRQQP